MNTVIVTRLISMGSLSVFGFIKGFQPIAGYSYGAKKFDRLREAIKTSILWKKQDNGDKANPLPASSEDETLSAFSQSKEQGRIHRIKSKEHNGNAVCP